MSRFVIPADVSLAEWMAAMCEMSGSHEWVWEQGRFVCSWCKASKAHV